MARSVRKKPVPVVPVSPWLTVREAARYLGVGVDFIYDACRARGLKHLKAGHSTIRIKRDWVDEWTEELARRLA